MAIDTQLVLDTGQTVSTTANTSYIEVEGGYYAIARLWTGAMSGGSTTCDIYIQQSLDAGSNYYMCPGGKFQQLGPTNDNAYMEIPIFIGLATTSTNKTRVRVRYVVAGGSPSYVITLLALDPMVSLAAPGNAMTLSNGLYSLVAAL